MTAGKSQSVFVCKKCGRATDHSRLNDPYAGELWLCKACGWKTMRDESQTWAQVHPSYSGTTSEAQFNEDMRNRRIRSMVDSLSLYMCGPWGFQDFTAAERSRIAHIFVRHWAGSDADIARELNGAGFSLEGGMSPPEKYVADVKRACDQNYRRIMGKKWWQVWR